MKGTEHILFNYDFTRCYNSKEFEIKVSADADIYRDKCGLIVNSTQYTERGIGLRDHIKCLAVANKQYKLCDKEVIYEACILAQQVITPTDIPNEYKPRIRNIREDYRLCSSGIMVYDEDNMLTAKILFTDQWIYGYYEIRPTYKPNWAGVMSKMGDYAAFTSIIPLCKRTEEFTTVAIGIKKEQLKFYINKKELYCIPTIGLRLEDQYQVSDFGGYESAITPGTLNFGFGNFSYLDHNIPNNYSREYTVNGFQLESALAPVVELEKYREPYPNFEGEHIPINIDNYFALSTGGNYLFGQGAVLHIKYVKVYIIEECKDNSICDNSDADYDFMSHHRGYKLYDLIKQVTYHKRCSTTY